LEKHKDRATAGKTAATPTTAAPRKTAEHPGEMYWAVYQRFTVKLVKSDTKPDSKVEKGESTKRIVGPFKSLERAEEHLAHYPLAERIG